MKNSTVAFETIFVDVAGKKTQLTRGGDGPPLLYLHSAGGETDWMPFHDLLAQHYTVYAPAHPGFALSEGLDEIDDLGDMVWHYVDLMETLGLTNVPVVGFSLGAWLGLELAIVRPELVQKLVIVAAAGLRVEGSPMAELFIDDFDKLRKLIFHDVDHPSVKLAMPDSLDDPRILLWLRAREATARVAWNPYLHNPKLPNHLRRIGCPVQVIWGREDLLIPVAHGEYYAQHLPHAQLQVIEDCGHMVPFEKCNEFVDATLSFLEQTAPVASTSCGA
ncbi:alpha/beta fold hydrolase [Lignipirellula cremea]|uniref:2-hydroxy-6-oxo-6-(2'-aminophenyl)hexa-2, 4-dienoic acid hydrolase n=1 Tax=Lignipirellula cremea TaxID=2528010 RepID=A0A518E3A1_9BACT|nr:alpha/beta fold hydrolase [Lignipirellula cremea]QDU98523.1 2-hydroxy-6-oxo-6-(2'-aminophenyl)hexa-2,4-dienoic acid hydrolase [Lignipirellula cremea]